MNYKQEGALDFALEAIKCGFRAFIAKSGTYGFYTDEEGTKVISFEYDFGGIKLSGNYKTSAPSQTGTGWRIYDPSYDHCDENIIDAFRAAPQQWAVRDATWKYTTLDQYLAQYQSSSRFEEVKADEH